MKRIILCFLLLMMAAGALADTAPVKMEVPPEAIETQAEGELETYDLTFPEDMPLAARNFVLFARAEFEKNDWTRLPKCNEYTQWYYHDKREIGWCSVFQIYCAYHSGLQLVRYKQDVDVQPGDCISAMEGRVGNVRLAFEEHGRWLDGTEGAVPKPGYLVIYGVRSSTPYTHVAIVESVRDLGLRQFRRGLRFIMDRGMDSRAISIRPCGASTTATTRTPSASIIICPSCRKMKSHRKTVSIPSRRTIGM